MKHEELSRRITSATISFHKALGRGFLNCDLLFNLAATPLTIKRIAPEDIDDFVSTF